MEIKHARMVIREFRIHPRMFLNLAPSHQHALICEWLNRENSSLYLLKAFRMAASDILEERRQRRVNRGSEEA